MESIGIDIGKNRCNACVKDASGTILHEAVFDTDVPSAKRFATDMVEPVRGILTPRSFALDDHVVADYLG